MLLLKPSTPSRPLLGVLGPINTANVLTSLLLVGRAAVTRLSLTTGIYYFFPCFSFHKQPALILLSAFHYNADMHYTSTADI